MTAREWLRRIFTTRRAREMATALALREAEVARLRAENRALLNSILGIAGIPPVLVDESQAAAAGAEPAPIAPRAKAPAARGLAAAAPLRRRSWQQIHRRLEMEAARKKTQEA